jgi:hypothetical protein
MIEFSTIEFFQIYSANGKSTVEYDGICTFKLRPGEEPIPYIRTVSGDKPEVLIAKKGTKWVDCLTPNSSYTELVWSERVIDAIERENLTGLRAGEVFLDLSKNPRLAKKPHPTYYMIKPVGRSLRFNLRVYERINGVYHFRFETPDFGDPRLEFKSQGYIHHIRFIPIHESWDGSDFMVCDLYPSGRLPNGGFYCSRKFVEIAKREGWSNFNFVPAGRIVGCIGDFRDRPWPPELWFPDKPAVETEPA